mmetsp:Transcript_32021/g.88203  ORF Transcript_32021/g.88203 Transcript_32021/m.88203 type:complete len:223 (-) Transcript_32021:770-1438(-)
MEGVVAGGQVRAVGGLSGCKPPAAGAGPAGCARARAGGGLHRARTHGGARGQPGRGTRSPAGGAQVRGPRLEGLPRAHLHGGTPGLPQGRQGSRPQRPGAAPGHWPALVRPHRAGAQRRGRGRSGHGGLPKGRAGGAEERGGLVRGCPGVLEPVGPVLPLGQRPKVPRVRRAPDPAVRRLLPGAAAPALPAGAPGADLRRPTRRGPPRTNTVPGSRLCTAWH